MTHIPSTHASLLMRLRDPRDHEAWLEFVALYEPVACRLLRRQGLQDADAQEVLQELFLAVSRQIEKWDVDPARGSFRGWLRRVTRNLLVNWLIQRKRRPVATGDSDLQALLQEVPAADGPESLEFTHELRRELFQKAAERVRNDVQPGTWNAFWETAIAGLPLKEVADKLGLSVGAVKVAKCRVLARIRTVVAELEDET